jgi:hypothetical protein
MLASVLLLVGFCSDSEWLFALCDKWETPPVNCWQLENNDCIVRAMMSLVQCVAHGPETNKLELPFSCNQP